MVPKSVIEYLDQHQVEYSRRSHPRAVSAQELAAQLHVSGYRVAKSVIVEADGRTMLCVLPAAEVLDGRHLAQALRVPSVRLMEESEFVGRFPECEPGAEPPFGKLYGLPVVVDARLAREADIVVRGGSHEEVLELSYADFERVEQPKVVDFGRPFSEPGWVEPDASSHP